MDINQIKYFLSVAQHLNFTKAAQENFITQPAMSRQISELEKEIGFKLFIRDSHSVHLTSQGKALLNNWKAAVRLINEGMKKANEIESGQAGSLKIAALTTATVTFLPRIIKSFKLKYPNVNITVDRLVPKQICNSIDEDKYDIYITIKNDIEQYPKLDFKTIKKDEICLVTQSEHSLAENDELDISSLEEETFFLIPYDDSPHMYKITHKVFDLLGIKPKKIVFQRPLEQLLYSVRSGLGVSVLPERICEENSSNLAFLKLNSGLFIELAVGWNSSVNPLANRFINILEDNIR